VRHRGDLVRQHDGRRGTASVSASSAQQTEGNNLCNGKVKYSLEENFCFSRKEGLRREELDMGCTKAGEENWLEAVGGILSNEKERPPGHYYHVISRKVHLINATLPRVRHWGGLRKPKVAKVGRKSTLLG